MCYFLIVYLVKIQKMVIIPIQKWVSALDKIMKHKLYS